MSVQVTVKSNLDAWLRMQEINLDNAVRAMADGINNLAAIKAPKLTGALKSDGRVEKIQNGYEVVYGDSRVPYARRRHFENNKHPDTKYYLQNAGEEVAKRGIGAYLK